MSAGFISSGVEPNLIHAVEVVIERLDLAQTEFDDVFREPVAGDTRYRTPETVLAQIHWEQAEVLVASAGGDDSQTRGWITMVKSQVDALTGGAFKKGDRIVRVDGEDLSANPLYIVQPRRAAQYTGQKLWKFFFATRQETTNGLRDNTGSEGQL